MTKQNLVPSNLSLKEITHNQILGGSLSNLPLMVHQVGILKEIHNFCLIDGKNAFVPVSSVEISRRLKKSVIAEFIPANGIDDDMRILSNRGWLDLLPDGRFLLSDHAKDTFIH